MQKKFIFIFLGILPVLVIAGGSEYEYGDDSAEAGPAYFGFVRDQRGVNLRGATVILQAKKGPRIEVASNVLGVYRTHYSKNTKPEDIDIRCEKSGYQFQKILVRTVSGTKYQEADCLMQANAK